MLIDPFSPSWQITDEPLTNGGLGNIFYDGAFHVYGSDGFIAKLPDGCQLKLDANGVVSVYALHDVDHERIAAVIQSTLFAARSWYQGRIPFNATAVLVGESVVLLGGESSYRREALALQFAKHGYAVSDSMIAIDPRTLLIYTNGGPLVLSSTLAQKEGLEAKPIFSNAKHFTTRFAKPSLESGYQCAGWIKRIQHLKFSAHDCAFKLTEMGPVFALNSLSDHVFLKGMSAMLMSSREYYQARLRLSRQLASYSLTYGGNVEIGAEIFNQILPEVLSWPQTGEALK